MIAIDVHQLRKSYGAVEALRGIDLSIRGDGQLVGLLGPNGAPARPRSSRSSRA
jgi:ABC-type multidrug transport system ATPase subunit